MKQFASRLALFLSIFTLIIIIKLQVVPYHYGSGAFTRKLNFIEAEAHDFNAVVFGSSRLYRQLNPVLLDSLLLAEGFSMYNFATDATYNPEAYYLYEHFIDADDHRISYAFLELQSLHKYSESNAVTTKGSYWNTLGNLRYCFKYLNHLKGDDNGYDVPELKMIYVRSFFKRIFDFTPLNGYSVSEKFVRGANGYYPCETELRNEKAGFLRDRNTKFQAMAQQAMAERINGAMAIDSLIASDIEANRIHLQYLTALIEKSKRRDIHLVIVLPPRLVAEHYLELIPIINSLPANHVIQVASYPEYENLYAIQNSFDAGHLNNKGSDLFTVHISERIREILRATPE